MREREREREREYGCTDQWTQAVKQQDRQMDRRGQIHVKMDKTHHLHH